MISTGFYKTNIEGKCDRCNHYLPRHKRYINLGNVKMCHGRCKLNDTYKQRTDTCQKFKERGEIVECKNEICEIQIKELEVPFSEVNESCCSACDRDCNGPECLLKEME